jgi:hypothetical protein
MLNSLKAITLGVITIFILGLINQLVLIMSAVAYHSLVEFSPMFLAWSKIFTYIIAAISFFIIMAIGGIVTARIAVENAYNKALIASFIGSSLSLSLSLKDEIFTPIAFFFIIYGLISSMIGCWLWQKYQKKTS